MVYIALAIATAIPLVFLYVVYTLDLYKTGEFRFVLIGFAWGGLAWVIARYVNQFAYRVFIFPLPGASFETVARYIAPAVEEILKALFLLYLVRRPNFTYFVDGAIYGFSIGIGFAVFENYEYVLGTNQALGLAIGRVLSSNLIHASASALVGVAVGIARFQRLPKKILFTLGGLLIAIAVHTVFNNLVAELQGSGMLIIYASILGISAAGVVAFTIKRGLAEEKTWIEEKLGDADRVTAKEAAAVQKLSSIQDVLAPLAERFGPEKAEQIENFLVIQARLGILRKTLDKLNDEKMRKSVEEQMAKLRLEMDKSRRQVGAYCMLYLRNIFPEDSSPLWGRLETAINEKIAARPATGGANLWASLGQKTAPKLDKPDPGAPETPASPAKPIRPLVGLPRPPADPNAAQPPAQPPEKKDPS
jgi:RsiW-degrading membrane proteinase PrsW (M82 family)